MYRNRKIKLIFFLIIILAKSGFSQNEIYKDAKLDFKLNINDGAAISAILEYKLFEAEEKSEQITLMFHTIKMRKRFFKKDFQKVKKITSSNSIILTNELKQILLEDKVLNLCENEPDMAGMQSDGIYFAIQIKKVDHKGLKCCSVSVDNSITSENNELGKLIKQILQEIRYIELEKEFKESLAKGYYYNFGHNYWKKK